MQPASGSRTCPATTRSSPRPSRRGAWWSGSPAPTRPARARPRTPPQTGFATVGPDPARFLISFPHILRNLPNLEQAAAGRGLFTVRPEWDGIVRRVPMVMKAEDKVVPALTLDLLRTVTGSGAILIRTDEAGVRAVAVPGLELPTDQNGRVWVHFGLHDKARYVSAKDVIEGKVAPEKIAGKLVLVGTSAIGLLDVKTTPVHPAMPGVEVHAQVLEAALTGSLLSRPELRGRGRDAGRPAGRRS